MLRRPRCLLLAGLFRLVVPLLVAILAGPALAQSPAGTGGRPNFLLILSDDQRHDTMDYMPRTKARIFGEGISFPNAYITTPLCCPSRSSVLTGMYAHKHGVRLNPIPLQKETFVQRLKEAGYFTGQVGKYLNSWDGSARPEFDMWAAGPGGTGCVLPRQSRRCRFRSPSECLTQSAPTDAEPGPLPARRERRRVRLPADASDGAGALAAVAVGARNWAWRSSPLRLGVVAMSGALLGQLWRNIRCPTHDAIVHVFAFHVPGVVLAALLGCLLAKLTWRSQQRDLS